ncbi:MAG TPA: response regulator [Candidatus Sulfopaludibacter sp.]|jgi:DNA-binding response OmpR family regulator|nr:response regulator [Candidatus Sulfopaludibacter sp.]
MAGESILVVDDAPVNLKLADILLRREGYQVHAVPDAEEALRVLRNFLPRVMLVDIQLPGIDGLELTRRVKQDPRTQSMTVIALTASAMDGDEERALAAGCDGYITKPIDTQTLGARIRQYMDRANQAAAVPSVPDLPSPPLPGGLTLSHLELESVRRRFLEEGALQCRQLLLDLNSQFDVARAGRLLHRWIGAGGALGYTDITAYSQFVEGLLRAPRLDTAALRESLSELLMAFSDPREASLDPLPESVVNAVAGKRIAMVGFAPDEAERLCAVFEHLGGRPRLFEPDEPTDSELVRLCDAVMVHVRPETRQAGWLSLTGHGIGAGPLLFVGSREQIMALDAAVQARAHEFLIDGWQPEEALMRLAFAMERGAAKEVHAAEPISLDRARVLVVDDDPVIRAVLLKTLQEYQVECRAASSGAEALQLIATYRPHAAVLDVNMPAMDGFELLKALRGVECPPRVVMLSARRQEQDIVHGFNLGADDYMVKPFSPPELMVRLKRLLSR